MSDLSRLLQRQQVSNQVDAKSRKRVIQFASQLLEDGPLTADHGERVETTAGFAPAFERALASSTGAVLEIPIATEALTPRMTMADLHASTKT